MPIKKYKKLLHSSCLVTIASLSLGMSASFTHAGFEWTPPPESVRPAPQKIAPVPSAPVEEDMLVDDPQNIMNSLTPVDSLPPVIDKSNEKPKLKIKVLTPDEKVPVIKPEKNTHKAPPLNVDLFPMGKEAENDSAPSNLTPIILPSDPEKGLDDLNAEDLATDTGNERVKTKAEKIIWSAPETFDVIEGFGSEMPLVLALRQIVPSKYAYSISDELDLGQKVSWEGGKPWNEVLTSTLAPIGIAFKIKGNHLHLNKTAVPEKTISKQPEVAEEPAVEVLLKKKEKPSETITPIKEILDPVAETESKTSGQATSSVSRRAILDPGKTESTQDEIIKQVMGDNGPEAKKIKITKKQDAPIEAPVDVIAAEKSEIEVEKPMPMPKTKLEPYTEDVTFNPPPSQVQSEIIETTHPAEPKLTLAQVNTKIHVWKANSGHNVKKLLEKWSSELDVKLDWQGNENIKLKQNVLINGTFKNALKILFDQDTVKKLNYDLVEANGGVKLLIKPRS